MKLDFRKAFDSIAWDSLDSILPARLRQHLVSVDQLHLALRQDCHPFKQRSRQQFSCARGLHKGNTLSPYLFIIVADLLRRMIEDACMSGALHHPLGVAGYCPVLQYADDTLIMVHGSLAEVVTLKCILDAFAAMTGLLLNYHKTTFIPMNVGADEAAAMASMLGCPIASFPQSYLGLPISPTRLHISDFAPLVAKSNKYLAGWKGRLLSSCGRLQLTNSILNSLPIYYMSSLPLHKTVIAAIDRRRRAFVWTGEEKCSGSRCLVAWDKAMLARLEGGLGIKNLEVQNHCLLLKFVHKSSLGSMSHGEIGFCMISELT